MKAEFRLRCFENGKRTAGKAKVKQVTAAGGHRLVVAGGRAEETAEFIVAWTEALR